jgi:hypothetical protein
MESRRNRKSQQGKKRGNENHTIYKSEQLKIILETSDSVFKRWSESLIDMMIVQFFVQKQEGRV